MNKLAATFTAFGLALGLGACTDMSNSSSAASASPSANMVAGPGAGVTSAAANPNVPGATGRSIVPGDNATLSGDSAATIMQRTGRV